MAQLSIADASAVTGKSRSTLLRAIKAGRLSASRDSAGAFVLDPAEVARVFPIASGGAMSGAALARHGASSGADDAAEVSALRDRLAASERRAAVAEAVAEERAAALADVRRSLADLRRLLPPPGTAPAGSDPGRPWWRFWR